jgi:hypothetical protein
MRDPIATLGKIVSDRIKPQKGARPAMKIYYFNPETRAYLGEDFSDEMPSKRGE